MSGDESKVISVDKAAEELDNEIKETKKLCAQLANMRRQYLSLTSECRDVEQVLADMKSSLFGLRVGAQVFEQLNQPLSDSVASVVDDKRSLDALILKANGEYLS